MYPVLTNVPVLPTIAYGVPDPFTYDPVVGTEPPVFPLPL